MTRSTMLAFLATVLVASPAVAHTGTGMVSGLGAGIGHPLAGLDHVLAMLAVGLWAAVLGGRAMWMLPAAFVAAVIAGGVIGLAWGGAPLVEAGIAGSVIVLGLAIAARVSPAPVLAAAVVGVFGVFHGHAHGTEIPFGASELSYGAGLVLSSLLLQALGLGLGMAADRAFAAPSLAARALGLAIAVMGIGIAAT